MDVVMGRDSSEFGALALRRQNTSAPGEQGLLWIQDA